MKPTIPGERLKQIDILRGFALFGVLFVNVFGYNASFFNFSGFYSSFNDSLNHGIFSFMIHYGADKFISIFSFLFGVGFSLLYLKYNADEKKFSNFYMRRLMVLALFGIIHILFFWAGDILLLYALMGFILLSLRKLPSGLLLTFSIIIYFFPVVYLTICPLYPSLPDALSNASNLEMPEVVQIYSGGSAFEVFSLRLKEYISIRNMNIFYYAPKILSLFILGSLFQKHNFLKKINRKPKRYTIIALILILSGISFNIFSDRIMQVFSLDESSPFMNALSTGVFELNNVFLFSGYILIICILSASGFCARLLNPLSYIGRMSLSNYLTHSIIFSFLMYAYGFGKFGSLEPWLLVIMALGAFILQVIFSKVWLKSHRFGPCEFLWRKLSYKL